MKQRQRFRNECVCLAKATPVTMIIITCILFKYFLPTHQRSLSPLYERYVEISPEIVYVLFKALLKVYIE